MLRSFGLLSWDKKIKRYLVFLIAIAYNVKKAIVPLSRKSVEKKGFLPDTA